MQPFNCSKAYVIKIFNFYNKTKRNVNNLKTPQCMHINTSYGRMGDFLSLSTDVLRYGSMNLKNICFCMVPQCCYFTRSKI